MASRTEGARPMLQPIQFPVKAPTGAVAAGTKVVQVAEAARILNETGNRDLEAVAGKLRAHGTEIPLQELDRLLKPTGHQAVELDHGVLRGAPGTAAPSAAGAAE